MFMPAGTRISASNVGNDSIHLIVIFSAPRLKAFMREASVLEGEKNVPLSQADNDEIEKKCSHDVKAVGSRTRTALFGVSQAIDSMVSAIDFVKMPGPPENTANSARSFVRPTSS